MNGELSIALLTICLYTWDIQLAGWLVAEWAFNRFYKKVMSYA